MRGAARLGTSSALAVPPRRPAAVPRCVCASLDSGMPTKKAAIGFKPGVLREVGAQLTLHTPSEAAYACADERALLVLKRRAEHGEHCTLPGCRMAVAPETAILCMAALRNAMHAIDGVAYAKADMWKDLLPHLNKNYGKRARRMEVFNRTDANFQHYLAQVDAFPCMCTGCGWDPITLPSFAEILATNIRNRAGTGTRGLNLLPSTVAWALEFLHAWLAKGGGVRCGRTNVATLLWLALIYEQNGFRNAADELVTGADIAACCNITEDTLRKCSDEIAPMVAEAAAAKAAA